MNDNRHIYLYYKGTMRKLQDMEHPLPLCLSWGVSGLDLRRYVLQENDTMEIVV